MQQAGLTNDQKHQMVLPDKHNVTEMIIRKADEKQFQLGVQATLNHVRQQFWPINGKSLTKKIIREFVPCLPSKGVRVCICMLGY